MMAGSFQRECRELIGLLESLRAQMLAKEAAWSSNFGELYPTYLDSARNLLHYLALRSQDLRPLQQRLSQLGLSSLGRSEANVLASVEAVLSMLYRASGDKNDRQHAPAIASSRLELHAADLLGPRPQPRSVRILVTLPTEAGGDPQLIKGLLACGMDCARINCAHDDAEVWQRMIENLRAAESELGKTCRVIMDLAGPKLRTGPLAPGPAVLKIRPQRDAFGRVVEPARLWLVREEATGVALQDVACAPVPGIWLERLAEGDTLSLRDARGRPRRLVVQAVEGDQVLIRCDRTVYLTPGLELRRTPVGTARPTQNPRDATRLGAIAAQPWRLRLRVGDTLKLTREPMPGKPARCDLHGTVLEPAQIACTLPEVFADVQPGQRIWFDDGRLGGIVRIATPEFLEILIDVAGPRGGWLGADKGINLPDTALRLPALTAKDLVDLEFVAHFADAVALSFVQDVRDVQLLEAHLARLGAEHVGIVLKIETRRAFEQLPELLLASMRSPCDGVMIARGDLAVQCGFERLAEVQEEILWLCEAAHIPVIWATQVLERLTKEGLPTRAEISDAAMAARAECVMVNKGPHLTAAVRALDDILRRMEPHLRKKRSLLCQLPFSG